MNVVVDPPQESVTITYPGGKAVSHYSFTLVAEGGDDGGDADAGGPDGDGDVDGDDSVDSVDGGDVSPGDGDDTAGTTGAATGGPTGGPTGGTTGGTTGGAPTPTGGNLPFTGLPVWAPLLVALALLGSGFVLLRRKGHVS